MAKKKTEPNNLRIAILFILLVVFFIAVSLAFKIFFLFRDSLYDGENRFTVAVFQKNNASLISVATNDKSITFLEVDGPIIDKNLARFTAVGIDATIVASDFEINQDNMGSVFSKMAFGFGDYQTEMSMVDLFRLGLSAKNIPSPSVKKISFHTKDDGVDIRSKLTNEFIDKKISSEGLRIEIVNASEVSGIANRLADLVSNIGGNVILASTADESREESVIQYSGENSYTVNKLSSILDIKTQKVNDKGISDVIIMVGKDKSNTLKF